MSRPPSSFYNDLTGQIHVIGALVIRELHTRFGRNNIGYLWMIGEPLTFATVIGILHSFQGAHTGSDINPVPFGILGYTVFIIFRGIFSRADAILEGNAVLLYHRMISVLTMSIARTIIETAGCFSALVILLSASIILGYANLPARPLYLFAGIAWLVWLAFGLGMIVTASVYERPTLGRLIHPITYFTMPISGAFLMMDWLSGPFKTFMEWNPMALIFEYVRYGMFESAPDTYLDGSYITACCAIVTYIGLIAIKKARERVHLS
ncbi:capsular polysaccharide transport system permease protein [Sphingomonas sp. YR710]|jgi:capsular polysaccharide transport system permease protein|uniref:ABC transporter permease n=1 Tax=Sphingomonas sp. YR710 TaxID=1882773 RepID=UPI0008838243|nr:ABC transporter permease [Sphingomonas sp. YR710]SDC06609.1 capsular polysaccharide transport system permease protein [Sphingomonas sp. YR710]